jgi:HAD superfamily hydrolase (TIGR01490 family)
MSRTFAFFDVDETLVRFKTMFAIRREMLRRDLAADPAAAEQAYAAFLTDVRHRAATEDRAAVNRWYYEWLRGRDQAEVAATAEDWFRQLVTSGEPVFIPEGLSLVRRLADMGHETVLVSGSAVEFVAPIARHLGGAELLCARLEVEAGRYTGRLLPPQTIGPGKRTAIERFLREREGDPARCFAVGDHLSDLPMLEAVGYPVVMLGDPRLAQVAHGRGWPVLRPSSAKPHPPVFPAA